MSSPDVVIYTDLGRETHLVGFLWLTAHRRGTMASTFQYADSWMENRASFAAVRGHRGLGAGSLGTNPHGPC